MTLTGGVGNRNTSGFTPISVIPVDAEGHSSTAIFRSSSLSQTIRVASASTSHESNRSYHEYQSLTFPKQRKCFSWAEDLPYFVSKLVEQLLSFGWFIQVKTPSSEVFFEKCFKTKHVLLAFNENMFAKKRRPKSCAWLVERVAQRRKHVHMLKEAKRGWLYVRWLKEVDQWRWIF